MAVAEKAALSQQQLCDIIAKRRGLDANELVSICRIIRVAPNELLGYGVGEIEKEGGVENVDINLFYCVNFNLP